jgi:PAS domain S-box-containing protein
MKQETAFDQGFIGFHQELLKPEYIGQTNILNLLPVAIYVCNAAGIIVSYNQKAVELWGRTPQKGEKHGQFLDSFKLYHSNQSYSSAGETLPATSLPESLIGEEGEMIIERPDLSRIVVRASTVPIKDEPGDVVGMIYCFYDITPQKKTQKELEWKSRELQDYVDNAAIGLHWVNEQGIIIWANKAELDMLGYTEEEYIGRHISEFHTDRHKIEDILDKLSRHEALNKYESILLCKDGTSKTVHISSNVFWEEGRFVHTRCFTIDVTEEKKLLLALQESERKYRELVFSLEKKIEEKTCDLEKKSDELRKSEERYHKMIEEVEDYAIILLNKDGIVQNWNRGAEKIKGYKEEEIVGKSFQQFYLPEDREKGLPLRLLETARRKGKANHEGWRMRKDGTVFWGSIVLTALHDNENHILGFTKVTRDLTEKKLAEDKMKEYTGQLEFQNKELEQFAYAASHDMKEPLRKIHFYNSFVIENTSNHLDERSREYLNRSAAAVRRMNTLIEDLLAYSRATSIVDSFEEVDANQVVEEIMLHHKEELEQKKVHIHFRDLPTLKAVPFQFKQLMDNLINNSVKYKHPDRDAVITIKSAQVTGAEIRDHLSEPDVVYHKISVIDNGIGFQSHHTERIFDIFQRLHGHPGTKGSGIGLAICKRIVQNHRGFIRATGKENAGARFDVFIPLNP